MASVVSKSKISYKCEVGPLKINFLALMIIILIIPGECEVFSEGRIFKKYKNASSDICSLEDPSHVLNNVRSKQECVLLCQADPRCSGVNWKEPSVCEMYYFDPGRFGRASRCSYFGPGEHSNLRIFLYINSLSLGMRRFEIENPCPRDRWSQLGRVAWKVSLHVGTLLQYSKCTIQHSAFLPGMQPNNWSTIRTY